MTDDSYHPADAEDRSEDHQQAVEATEHAVDALRNGDTPMQEQRETAFDCYG